MNDLDLDEAIEDLEIKCEEEGRLVSKDHFGYHVKHHIRTELLTPTGAKFVLRWATRSFPIGGDPTGAGPTAADFTALPVEDRKGIARFFIKSDIEFPDWMREGIRKMDLRRTSDKIYCFGFDINNGETENLEQKMVQFVDWCRNDRRRRFSFGDLQGMWNRMITDRFPRGGERNRSRRRRRRRSPSFSGSSSGSDHSR